MAHSTEFEMPTIGHGDLPIIVTDEQAKKPRALAGLAAKALRCAGYDMLPDNPVDKALKLGYLRVVDTDEV